MNKAQTSTSCICIFCMRSMIPHFFLLHDGMCSSSAICSFSEVFAATICVRILFAFGPRMRPADIYC